MYCSFIHKALASVCIETRMRGLAPGSSLHASGDLKWSMNQCMLVRDRGCMEMRL